jgi:predicted amidohydrolase YtcJ
MAKTSKTKNHVHVVVSTAAALAVMLPAFAGEKADLIVKNARVFTGQYSVGRQSPQNLPTMVSCLACSSGTIVYVGDEAGTLALKGPKTKVLDLGGKLVLPGFHDCHVHLCEGGLEHNYCQLSGSKTKQAALLRLKAYAAKHDKEPGSTWLKASGLPLPAVKTSPLTRSDIDKIESTRPVIIYSEDAHSLWLNTRALQLAKIDEKTSTPEAGVIEHEKDGSPNGCLREEAMELITDIVPVEPLQDRAKALKKAVLLANSLGITSIQDAHAREDFLSTYFELAKKNELNLKVVAALHTAPSFKDSDFDHLVELREKYTTGNLKATSAKIFADGVIETHTAAMLEPYSNDKNNSGTLYSPPEQLKSMVQALDKRGFQVHIHAIGDRAVRSALDAFEAAKSVGGAAYDEHRHQMAHLEVVQKNDIPRFKKLGVIANFQAYWAFNDPYMTELTVPAMGPERMKLIYPIHSVLTSGARLAAGSDWTVSTLNPLKAMQIAVTRKPPDNPSAKVLLPEERVKLKDILAAYTTGGAYANHSEDKTGSLTVGKAADFIVLDRNIFAIKPELLGQTRVLKTYVDGNLVFDRSKKEDLAVSE